MSESVFFQDLAVLMVVAGLASAIFSHFGWPKVLGYLAAGVLLSDHTWGGGLIIDMASVQTIGQLGVVFLMFSMGLEFSTTEMKRVKNVALPTALIDTLVMMWLGYTVASRCFGWGMVASLFLGAAICDSATTMLAKMIDELGWRRRTFVGYTLGTSVCEDIVTVGILALCTGVATGQGASVAGVAKSMAGLMVFFVTVIVVGLVEVPRLLTRIARHHDDEVLLLVFLGLCFGVSYIAYKFDFSLALGAFLVGILGAASDVRVRINALVLPLRSMFAAVFFVSIGALVNPAAWLSNWCPILILVALVMGGKFVNVTLGGLLTGEGVKNSVQMGMSLAQIGEFSFMVALMYLGYTSDNASPIYQIVVAVSLITTLMNPMMLRASEPVAQWFDTHVPNRLHNLHRRYRDFVHRATGAKGERLEKSNVKKCFLALAALAIINAAVAICVSLLYRYDWSRFSIFFEEHDQLFFSILINVYLVAMFAPVTRLAGMMGDNIARLILGHDDVRRGDGAFRQMVSYVVKVLVDGAFFVQMTMINVSMAPGGPREIAILTIAVLLTAALGWRYFTHIGYKASRRFREALGADERRQKYGEMMIVTVPQGALTRLPLEADSPAVGGTVVSLNIRAKTGASIVSIIRDNGRTIIRNVSPRDVFQVGDTLVATGSMDQIAALREILYPSS